MEAITDGYAEGIALDMSGNVSEGSGQNIFIVRDGVDLHAADRLVDSRRHHARLDHDDRARPRLRGHARQTLPREALYIADEVFFVGTAAEVTPIRSVDKIKIGAGRRGPVTEALQRAFFDIVNGDAPDTHGWLTYVYPTKARCARGTGRTSRPGLEARTEPGTLERTSR